MSMTCTDALTTLARGLQKFEGATAGQVLASDWPGLKGLHPKDLAFFKDNADKSATSVASACHGRGAANPSPSVSPTDTIVITAPAGTKARWVRQSQREGKKLSDWIIQHVEASMSHQIKARIIIPADVQFSDLKMARDPVTGYMAFDWAPIERICEVSGIDIRLFRDQSEDNVAGVLSMWYAQHRAAGGEPDLVFDQLIAEADIDDSHGHGFSHQSGQA
jgi:hypothetical protein